MMLPTVSAMASLELLTWMFWKREANLLLHSGEFSFFTCFLYQTE